MTNKITISEWGAQPPGDIYEDGYMNNVRRQMDEIRTLINALEQKVGQLEVTVDQFDSAVDFPLRDAADELSDQQWEQAAETPSGSMVNALGTAVSILLDKMQELEQGYAAAQEEILKVS